MDSMLRVKTDERKTKGNKNRDQRQFKQSMIRFLKLIFQRISCFKQQNQTVSICCNMIHIFISQSQSQIILRIFNFFLITLKAKVSKILKRFFRFFYQKNIFSFKMQTILATKIKQIINNTYISFVQLESQKMEEMIKLIGEQIKKFMKDEQSTISKDILKKTKELFILSSDNQAFKQQIEDLQTKLKRLNEKLGQKEKQIVKIMNDNVRQRRQLEQKLTQSLNEMKKQVSSLELKLFETETNHKAEVSDLRKSHKQEISLAISRQQHIAENNIEKLKEEYKQQKKTLIQTQNKQKSELIKKYETKLQDLRDNNQKEISDLTREHRQVKEKDSKIKSDLNNQLFKAENTIKRLQGQLSRETLGHQRIKSFSQSLTKQLQDFNLQYNKTVSQLKNKLQSTVNEQTKNQKHLKQEISKLKEILQTTINEKDLLFQQTVNTMTNEHRDELDSTKAMMMEDKQIELTKNQMKHYNEVEKLNGQYDNLQKQYKQLIESYKVVEQRYEDKISKLIKQYETKLQNIQKRNDYQLNVEEKSAKKSLQVIERKYKLEIRSLKKQFEEMREELTKKINEEKVATTNKLTTQYEAMINDIRVNNEVNMKQKLIEFDRKSKAYEKKLAEAEKRRVDLKIQMDRQKLQMQMKLDSLSQLNDKNEMEIDQLHRHIVKMEKQKTKLSNDYDFKLIVKKNQLQQFKDDFEVKEHQLRNTFNEQIRIKNKEIQRFSEKVALQVQNLIEKHKKRLQLIQKQYNELQKIMNQRTSLPQDIQALKIFHAGFLKLQEELEKQKQMKRNVQRQLHQKCAIEKVFAGKSFVPRVEDPNPIKIVTMKQFYKEKQKSSTFRSKNI